MGMIPGSVCLAEKKYIERMLVVTSIKRLWKKTKMRIVTEIIKVINTHVHKFQNFDWKQIFKK